MEQTGDDMTRITKRTVRMGIAGAKEMLERNADTIDTFEGVLRRRYVRDLKTLIVVGERYLELWRRVRISAAQANRK